MSSFQKSDTFLIFITSIACRYTRHDFFTFYNVRLHLGPWLWLIYFISLSCVQCREKGVRQGRWGIVAAFFSCHVHIAATRNLVTTHFIPFAQDVTGPLVSVLNVTIPYIWKRLSNHFLIVEDENSIIKLGKLSSFKKAYSTSLLTRSL